MAQNNHVSLDDLTFGRADYTALRAYILKIPLQRIADLYYSEDSPQVEQGLERFLIGMRDTLIERAIEHNPSFAEILKGARQGGAITSKALEILIKAADLPKPVPAPTQSVSQWMRPKAARALRDAGIVTLADLLGVLRRRGPGWWRSVPRIGAGRAQAIERWLRRWPEQLGEIDSNDTRALVVSDAPAPVLDTSDVRAIAPLGTFTLPSHLDGVRGFNRAPAFCFISARNDLEAINCYLARYEGQAHTQRAYRKELERFILWCAFVACKPMSSLLVDDCDAYAAFLRVPLSDFCGPKATRNSKRWRPFDDKKPLSGASQKFAVTILRAAFDWFVKVRYLGGNPWVAVKDPVATKRVHAMKIKRALPEKTWETVVHVLRERCEIPANHQDRAALAALLLMGDSGLRRIEVVRAERVQLIPSPDAVGVWILTVLGKRSIEREVPVSPRTVVALCAHLRDRGIDFDNPPDGTYLLAPVVIPETEAAQARHLTGMRQGYHENSLYDLVVSALRRVREHAAAASALELPLLTPEEMVLLAKTSPHAFRHTFGTLAVERDMPIVVAQDILGHASASTTAIYVKAKTKRIAQEAGRYYAALPGSSAGMPTGEN